MVRAGAGEMKAHQTLKEFRNDRGMTQRVLADLLGVDPSYISQIEIGAKRVTDRIKTDFIELFGVDFEEMYKDVPKNKIDKKTMPKKGQPSDIHYLELAQAIIRRWAKDYKKSLVRLKKERTISAKIRARKEQNWIKTEYAALLLLNAKAEYLLDFIWDEVMNDRRTLVNRDPIPGCNQKEIKIPIRRAVGEVRQNGGDGKRRSSANIEKLTSA